MLRIRYVEECSAEILLYSFTEMYLSLPCPSNDSEYSVQDLLSDSAVLGGIGEERIPQAYTARLQKYL
jgi:hypothetical protein